MSSVLGIDVSKLHLDVALKSGEKVVSGRFTNDSTGLKKLAKWTAKESDDAAPYSVCIEATGRYSDPAAVYFFEHGHPVYVVNPARIKAHRQTRLKRHKTDREDAKLIAHFAATQSLTKWAPPSAHSREIKEISRHLSYLKKERTRIKNRISSGTTSRTVSQALHDQLTFLEMQIEQITKRLNTLVQEDDETKDAFHLLISIPGIGELTAATLLAEIGDFSRFDSPKQLVAHAGLSPRIFESGTSVSRRSHISKTGNVHLREMMYMPAMVAIRCNPATADLVSRLEAKGKAKKVIICAVMRKLLHIVFGVLKHQRPFDPQYSVVNSQNTS